MLDRFGELALEMRLSTGEVTAASRDPSGEFGLVFLRAEPPGDSSSSYVSETVLLVAPVAIAMGNDWTDAPAVAVCVSSVDSEQLELAADLCSGVVGTSAGRGIRLGQGRRQLGSSRLESDRVTSSGRLISVAEASVQGANEKKGKEKENNTKCNKNIKMKLINKGTEEHSKQEGETKQ